MGGWFINWIHARGRQEHQRFVVRIRKILILKSPLRNRAKKSENLFYFPGWLSEMRCCRRSRRVSKSSELESLAWSFLRRLRLIMTIGYSCWFDSPVPDVVMPCHRMGILAPSQQELKICSSMLTANVIQHDYTSSMLHT